MSSDVAAVVALVVYAAIGCAAVVLQVARSRVGWVRWLMYVVNKIYISLAFRCRSNRRCPFPAEGAAIIIANHRSPVDPMVVWANHRGSSGNPIRLISCLMAREYYEPRGNRFICKAMDAIPLTRDGNDVGPVREALRRLRDGKLIGVFPEGRINLVGDGLLEADTGLAWLALKGRVPVYPVYIHNAPQKGDSMVVPFLTPQRIRLSFGEPIDLSPYYGRRATQLLLREVTDRLMRRLAALGSVPYPLPSAEDDADTIVTPPTISAEAR